MTRASSSLPAPPAERPPVPATEPTSIVPRRVLFIAYYFPPAGGPAVQRTLQFVEHLSAWGWTPTVLTVREGSYPNRDPSLFDDVPPEVDVERTRSIDPLNLYARLTADPADDTDGIPAGSLGRNPSSWIERIARWVRANVFIPDARVGWWPFAVRRGRRLLQQHDFDAILTTGPPHSVHLIGRSLHRSSGLPWVADMRDPWTDISYYRELPHTRWAARMDAALERSVLHEADAVTTVSRSWRDLFTEKVPGRYAVIENGFSADDVATLQGEVDPDRFVIAHVGKLYASRNPTALWAALADLRHDDTIPDLTVRLVGSVDPVVRRSIEHYRLEPIVEFVPFLPHEEALQEMARSTLLLLVIEPFGHAEGMITSKLYEYLASERPVLGIGPAEGDADAILRQHDAGRVVGWSDVQGVESIITRHYDAWKQGTPRAGAAREDVQVRSRRMQAQAMAELLDEVRVSSDPVEA